MSETHDIFSFFNYLYSGVENMVNRDENALFGSVCSEEFERGSFLNVVLCQMKVEFYAETNDKRSMLSTRFLKAATPYLGDSLKMLHPMTQFQFSLGNYDVNCSFHGSFKQL